MLRPWQGSQLDAISHIGPCERAMVYTRQCHAALDESNSTLITLRVDTRFKLRRLPAFGPEGNISSALKSSWLLILVRYRALSAFKGMEIGLRRPLLPLQLAPNLLHVRMRYEAGQAIQYVLRRTVIDRLLVLSTAK